MAEATKERDGAVGYAFRKSVVRRNLIIAAIVGTLLTLANQFDVLFSGPLTPRLGLKVFMNFLIPFAVSSTSAVINRSPDAR